LKYVSDHFVAAAVVEEEEQMEESPGVSDGRKVPPDSEVERCRARTVEFRG
jgi:hypothetical protein